MQLILSSILHTAGSNYTLYHNNSPEKFYINFLNKAENGYLSVVHVTRHISHALFTKLTSLVNATPIMT